LKKEAIMEWVGSGNSGFLPRLKILNTISQNAIYWGALLFKKEKEGLQ